MDKDGTLLEDVPYNADPERMRFAAGAAEGLRTLGRLCVPLIVVSNQPGIALKRFPIGAMQGVARKLALMFKSAGAELTAFYYCPHHREGLEPRHAIDCNCRKPAPGLIERAAAEHGIETGRSWMIGDILDDVEAGRRAGCRTILIDNGNETLWQRSALRAAHHVVCDLSQAATIVRDCAPPDRRAGTTPDKTWT